MSSEFYNIIVLLMVFAAAFAYVNQRFIKLPSTIGIMLISLVCSLLFVLFGSVFPQISKDIPSAIRQVDFETLLMNIMLGFILFAGGIHVNVKNLKKESIPVITLATVGMLLSTTIIGFVMFFVFKIFGSEIGLTYCFLFGALISPTDPIAVLGILKKSNISPAIETRIVGESLFNDGVAVVTFLAIIEVAALGMENLSVLKIGWLFIREAGGGLIWGVMLGYIGFYLIRSINDYQLEIIITLAMVMGGYAFATWIHVSGPLSMVVAGLITGHKGRKSAMTPATRDYLGRFWELLDELLNAFLFLLIGLEIIVIHISQKYIWISLVAIVVVLIARFISILIPISILSFKRTFEKNSIPVLTWGGLKGGVSVALALSLPARMHRNEFVTITYIIVIFSIIFQGLTVGKIARKMAAKSKKN